MNFLKSRFNKLVRTFPEWHDMDSALEDALHDCQKKRASFEQAQGNAFSEFTRKQPDCIAEALNRLDEKIKIAHESDNAADDALPKLRTELNKLRPLNDDIMTKRKARDSLKDKAEKSQKNVERLQVKMDQLKIRAPGTAECNKAEDEHEIACRTHQIDQQNYEEKEKAIIADEIEYKKQLFMVILNALGEYATAKGQSCASLVSLGDQIADMGQDIPTYDDPGIEILQTQLQGLRSESLD